MSCSSPPAATPPSLRLEARLRNKPSPSFCLASFLDAAGDDIHHDPTPPPRKSCSKISASPLQDAVTSSSDNHVPLRELLLLSPSPPVRRHRQRLHIHADSENIDPDLITPRRKCKNHRPSAATGYSGLGIWCPSPRSSRRSRRRLERDILTREERERVTHYEEAEDGRPRRLRSPSKAGVSDRKEEPLPSSPAIPLALPPPVLSESAGPINNEDDEIGLKGVCELISELVMWKDAAKSSLWFGFGTLCFASSSFSKSVNFNFVSVVSHVGLLVLALAFFCDTFLNRFEKRRRQLRLREEDILRVIRLALPAANAAMAGLQDVFSGEPSMTLKVAPVLFFATKYGHVITLGRLLTAGFFLGFSVPKFYSSHSNQIHSIAESASCRISEAWTACRHKRAATLAAGLMFWGLLSVKTRVFAAFVAVVMLRYRRQQLGVEEEAVHDEVGEKEEGMERRGEEGEKEVETLAAE